MNEITVEIIKVAIIGNPNVGKSVLFNSITGASQIIGNWCGKTTEVCTMAINYDNREFHFTDLPGIYGYGSHSSEEILVNDFLREEPPDVVMVVLDAMNLERGLYLLLETMERYHHVMAVLNKLEIAFEQELIVYHDRLEEELQVPVVPEKKQGTLDTAELFATITNVASHQAPRRNYAIRYGERVERALMQCKGSLQDGPQGSARWLLLKRLETESDAMQSDIISTRYNVAEDIAARIAAKRPTGETLSDRIDRWALHPLWGGPLMLLVFGIMFYLTFAISRPLSEWIAEIFDGLGIFLAEWFFIWNVPGLLSDLIVGGILKGVGAAMGFLPQMAMFFLFYSLIQDSGYMVRIVFLADKIMSAMGMNGKTFLPLVLGCSCNVNGILASRILSSRYDRTVAILVSSYAPCPARLGVMVFLVSAFFASTAATVVMLSLLGISLLLMVLVAYIVSLFIPRDGESSFMMELPPYQTPTMQGITTSAVWMTLNFVHRIRNVIIAASVVMWCLSKFPAGPFEHTYIAKIGQILEPVGDLMGLSWQLIVALIFGIAAKESVLSSLGIIYHAAQDSGNLAEILTHSISPLTAFTFLLVYMIYTPCVTTLVTMYQETKDWRIVVYGALGSIVSAVVLGSLVFHGGRLLLR
ncbi:MAG: ferrous iron transport protein B [Veillonellaceae bacterium]|nr:ferrous iron transport protein B [Veillonellaceae bacterium]